MISTFSLNPEVARKVHEEYRWILQEMKRDRSDSEPSYLTNELPSVEQIQSLIEASFWASFERIEGRHHRFCIAVCPKRECR